MTTKDSELLCKTGHNSPASRPEFVDINLDEVTASGTEQLGTEEQPARIESKIRTENKGNSNHHQIMAGAIVVLRLVLHLQYLPLEPQLNLLHLLRFLLVRFAQWVLKLALIQSLSLGFPHLILSLLVQCPLQQDSNQLLNHLKVLPSCLNS